MSEGLRGSCNAMPPEDRPKKPDPVERRLQDLERRVEILENTMKHFGFLEEKDGT